MKFIDGGWLPFVIGLGVFLITFAWTTGQRVLRKTRDETGLPIGTLIDSLAYASPYRVQGTAVFMMPSGDAAPVALLHHLKHNQVLHEHVVLLTIRIDDVPRIADEERMDVIPLKLGFTRMMARYGYMDEAQLPALLALAADRHADFTYDAMTTSYYLGRDSLRLPHGRQFIRNGLLRLFVWLHRNELDPTVHFSIPPNRVVELGARLDLKSVEGL